MELKGFIRDYGIGTTGDMASGGYSPSRGDPNCHARDLYEATSFGVGVDSEAKA